MRFPIRTLALFACATIGLSILAGCDRRTPDERLQTAVEFYQQGDQLSAEMEAQKVVEKAPEDPASIQANMLLAQIYASQNRFDEAEIQMKSALDNVSQLDPMGKEVLRIYLALLNTQQKYDAALDTVSKYQQEYAEDPGTSLSLLMAGVEIQTMAGQTTAARETLNDVVAQTTAPEELTIYRQMYVSTFMRDGNTTAAIDYLEVHLPETKNPEVRRGLMGALAQLYGANDDYAKSRFYLEDLTTSFIDALRQELDVRGRVSLVLQLGQSYLELGNLPGGRRVFQTLYDSNPSDPQALVAAVNGLTQTLLRQGDTSATANLLKDAATRHPEAPFAEQLQRMEELVSSGELQKMSPMDTSTLALKYKADPSVLWPLELPEILGVETTGTDTMSSATTGTLTEDGTETDTVAMAGAAAIANTAETSGSATIATDLGTSATDPGTSSSTNTTTSAVTVETDALTTSSGVTTLPPLDTVETTGGQTGQ